MHVDIGHLLCIGTLGAEKAGKAGGTTAVSMQSQRLLRLRGYLVITLSIIFLVFRSRCCYYVVIVNINCVNNKDTT